MSRALFLLLPALVFQAQDSVIPRAVEVRPGVFVLKGLPNEETCVALKKNRFTHVVDLRRDGEPSLNCEAEASRMMDLGIQYLRYAINTAPPAADFDFLRSFLKDLPKGSRVLFHCGDGNRAAAAVCPWMVLDKGVPLEEAIRVAKRAGLQRTDTEEALRRYLSSRA
jgi:protein tyrosine phosphatase (PTP) superfamily phosphohydrolase (DUF442 family)